MNPKIMRGKKFDFLTFLAIQTLEFFPRPSRQNAYIYFHDSNFDNTHKIHDSDIFQLKIWKLDKNNLFVTLLLSPEAIFLLQLKKIRI